VWLASSKFANTASYLGLQDAARKRMAPSQNPEPWFGAKVSTTAVAVFQSTAQKQWDKTKAILARLRATLENPLPLSPMLAFGQLRRGTGFLMYMCMTYPAMVPYMKGFYLTLSDW
jgi:hypothetical protein